MDKRVLYTRSDGGLSIVIPAETASLDDVMARSVAPDASDIRVVDAAVIPSDRTFRDAWKNDLTVDMPRARAIHMNRIRVVRDNELARLDIEQLRGNDVAAEKQKLRDIPQTLNLELASTPEQLKALWPTDLPKE